MTGATLALVAVGLLAATWLLGRGRDLDPATPDEEVAGSVSVVIPARDEAASLPRLLASLAAADPAPLEVVVVDDGSSDGTGDLARAAGATVVAAPPPPPGWLGKTWACQQGADAAAGATLVFLDADTWLAPDALARLVATHGRHPEGLLSVQPFHEVPSAVEQLSALPNLVSVLASGAFTPRGEGATTVAYGPCLLTSAASYRAAGGHAAVAGEVIEDLALAARYRGAGLPVHARLGGDAVRFRMYPEGARPLVEGWTKNLAGGARRAPVGPTLGAVAWVAAAATLTAAAVSAVVGPDGGPSGGPGGAPPLVGAWALFALHLGWMLRRLGSFRPWVWLAFPLPLLAFVGLFARSVWARAVRRSVRWRGREVAVGRG